MLVQDSETNQMSCCNDTIGPDPPVLMGLQVACINQHDPQLKTEGLVAGL